MESLDCFLLSLPLKTTAGPSTDPSLAHGHQSSNPSRRNEIVVDTTIETLDESAEMFNHRGPVRPKFGRRFRWAEKVRAVNTTSSIHSCRMGCVMTNRRAGWALAALGSAGTKSRLLQPQGDHGSTIGCEFDPVLQLCFPSPELFAANAPFQPHVR
jgi:hypothetical protein